ncbi:MAG: hypothetical protein ACFFB3_16340 [Candidatus Hodarchaeota archaeon]
MRDPAKQTPEEEHLMTTANQTEEAESIQSRGIKKLKGAEVQFECSCGEKVSIPFTFRRPITKVFTIPCLCQMHYTIRIDRDKGSITVEVLGERDQLETIF